jgi:hypothetical protein
MKLTECETGPFAERTPRVTNIYENERNGVDLKEIKSYLYFNDVTYNLLYRGKSRRSRCTVYLGSSSCLAHA